MTKEYNTGSHRKYLLQAHVIFSTKYRKQILVGQLATDLKEKILEIANESTKFEIEYQETDKDHIHLLISYNPEISISQIIRKIKSETTSWIWKKYSYLLKEAYWKSPKLWTPAYFCCSVGNVSAEILAKYIQNQG